MANLEELVVQLTAETSGLRAELASAARTSKESIDKIQGSLDDLSKNSQKNLGFFQASLAHLAGELASHAIEKGLELIKEGLEFVIEKIGEGVEAAARQETALQNLANAMALTGHYSTEAQKGLKEFADEMEATTNVADDVIESNLAVLASMTKLDAEGLKKAEKAALGLSAAYGMDLDSAVRLVGKGIEGNTDAFKRYGIEIQGTSDKALNLSNIMKAVPFEAATGKLNTFSGAMKAAQNSFENYAEALGSAVVNNPVVIAMLQELTKIFNELTTSADESAVVFRENVAEALTTTANVIGVVLVMVDNLIRGLKAVATFTANAFEPMDVAFQKASDALNKQTIFGDIAEQVAKVGYAGEQAFDKIKDSANEATPSIGKNVAVTKELTEAQKAHNEMVKSFATSLTESARQAGAMYEFQAEVLKNAMETEQITKEQYFAASLELQAKQFADEQAMLEEAHANKLISETAYRDAQTGLAMKQAQAEMALQAQKTQYEKDQQKTRAENLKSSFSYIASLSQSGNSTLAAIGKAAAITTATIDGYAAVQKALAAAPPPFNFALAALVGTATAANVAKIAGVGLAGGATEIPKSPGGGNFGDNFPAVLKPGERVVDVDTNNDLKAFLAGNGGGRTINISITIAPGTGISREQAGYIVEGINDYVQAGGQKLL